MKSINCKVVSITGELLIPEEEIKPPTIWEQFEQDIFKGLTESQGNLPVVIEQLKSKYKLKKHDT